MPVEVSELAGDDLYAGHHMLKELHVDLLREGGLLVRGRPRDVQQVHQRLDRPALTKRQQSVSKYDFLKPLQVFVKCAKKKEISETKNLQVVLGFLKEFAQEE